MCDDSFAPAANNFNFSASLKNKIVPSTSSFTFEGIINQYFFDTGKTASSCQSITEPYFAFGVDEKRDVYLSIGLNSVYDSNPPRRPLKTVFLLDISGSMEDIFDSTDVQGIKWK